MFKKLGLAVVVALLPLMLMAAVTQNAPIFPQALNTGVTQFLQGTDSAATYKTVFTAGANGSKLYGLFMNNNDGSATHLITCQVIRSAVKYGFVALTSVSNAGYASGTAAQNLMSSTLTPGLPVDSDGNLFLNLASGDTVQCTYATALTASTWVDVIATGVDF